MQSQLRKGTSVAFFGAVLSFIGILLMLVSTIQFENKLEAAEKKVQDIETLCISGEPFNVRGKAVICTKFEARPPVTPAQNRKPR